MSDRPTPRFGPRPSQEDAVQEAIYARMGEFPHMCQDGHPPIGFTGDFELCPLCDANAASERAHIALSEREAECARLRAVIANQLTQHMEASGEYSSAPTPGAET